MTSEIHFKAVIERLRRCNWRPRSTELRDASVGHDRVILDIHLDAEIK